MIKARVDGWEYGRSICIWIFDDFDGQRKILHYKDGKWSADASKSKDLNSEDEPSIYLPGRISREVMQALSNAFAEYGIKTDNDHKIQGTLEATKFHLEDLRKLLKLKK